MFNHRLWIIGNWFMKSFKNYQIDLFQSWKPVIENLIQCEFINWAGNDFTSKNKLHFLICMVVQAHHFPDAFPVPERLIWMRPTKIWFWNMSNGFLESDYPIFSTIFFKKKKKKNNPGGGGKKKKKKKNSYSKSFISTEWIKSPTRKRYASS